MPEHLTMNHEIGRVMALRRNGSFTVRNIENEAIPFNAFDTRIGREPNDLGLQVDVVARTIRNVSGKTLTLGVSYSIAFTNVFQNGFTTIWFEINGNESARIGMDVRRINQNHAVSGSAFFALANNEYFEFKIYQNSGGNLTIGTGARGMPTGFSNLMQITVIK